MKGGAFVADWKKIKKEYIAGGVSYKALAEKYGVSFSTIQKIGAKERWSDLRKKSSKKAEEKVVEAVSSRNARFEDAVDLALEAACNYLKAPGQLRAVDIKDVTTALKNLRDLKGIKSDADIEEQKARIEALRARAAMNKPVDDEDEQVGVIVLPSVDMPPGGDDCG
jgi:transposase